MEKVHRFLQRSRSQSETMKIMDSEIVKCRNIVCVSKEAPQKSRLYLSSESEGGMAGKQETQGKE